MNKRSIVLKVFVANRVAHIQQKTIQLNAKWNWIHGKENPADAASRGISVTELANHSIWWEGPSWLRFEQEHWRIFNKQIEPEENINTEINHEVRIFHHAKKVNSIPVLERGPWYQFKRPGSITNILDVYSSFNKMKRVIATVFRTIFNFKNYSARCAEPINPDEVEKAGIWLIHQDQKTTFMDEYQNPEPKKGGPHAHLTFEKDEKLKILRILGRVVSSNLTFDEQKPIVLSHMGKEQTEWGP